MFLVITLNSVQTCGQMIVGFTKKILDKNLSCCLIYKNPNLYVKNDFCQIPKTLYFYF